MSIYKTFEPDFDLTRMGTDKNNETVHINDVVEINKYLYAVCFDIDKNKMFLMDTFSREYTDVDKSTLLLSEKVGVYKDFSDKFNKSIKVPSLKENIEIAIQKMHTENKRMRELLEAVTQFCKKQEKSYYVINFMDTTVYYDGTDNCGNTLYYDKKNKKGFMKNA